jgi:hypothetical protein
MFLAIVLGWALASAETTTFFSFSRRIQTCDPTDRPLEEATSKIVFSYHSQDPVNPNSILQHEEKGVKSVRFFNDHGEPNLPSDAQSLDIKVTNQKIIFNSPNTGPTTQYWCSAYKIQNTFSSKRQIIRVEPIIDPKNFQNVHHILVYLCSNLTDTDLAYQGGCYQGADTPTNLRQCNGYSVVSGWAVGGYPQDYPDYLGMPLQGDTLYMMMEVHYDNPKKLEIVDSSGMRFWHTGQMRQYDAGTMNFGYAVDEVFLIPPGQTAYEYTAHCPSECSKANIPPEGIYITGVNLHTHVAGRQVYFRHFRNGTELAPILSEPYYDFNFQEMTTLPQERLVLPGDSFQVNCYYDTTDRVNATNMGLSTQEEMCLAYALYYPKLGDSHAEHCMYGNYTGIGYMTNQTVVCGSTSLYYWKGPDPYTPYVPPPCVYNAPPANVSTVPKLVDGKLDTSRYINNVTLDQYGNYKLYYSVDRENLLFHAAVEVKTAGWVGLGISPAGMEGADVLIAWVKDGEIYFGDRFAYYKALPPLDAYQDFYDISGGQYTTSPAPLLSTEAIVGIGVGGGLILVGLFLVLFVRIRGSKKGKETLLTTDTYGGVTDNENLDPPSMNQKAGKEAVPL